MTRFSFTVDHQWGKARTGTMQTAHGTIKTPIFMPVGTQASVKSLDCQDLEKLGAQIILANTYHLWLRPGPAVIRELGGVHTMMGWTRPLLTDSGGFQVFSLGAQAAQRGQGSGVRITDEGVVFASHLDGQRLHLTPETAMEIQQAIGADIMMAFDECTPDDAPVSEVSRAVIRTADWLDRCVQRWEARNRLSDQGHYQALFGIIQGARSRQQRLAAWQSVRHQPCDGWAVGGETIGYQMAATAEVMSWLEPELPADKLRYAMGLGRDPQNIIDAVMMGFDMFDCVGPTRLARNGSLFVGQLELDGQKPFFSSPFPAGRLRIDRAEFGQDTRVLQEGCGCHTCQAGYSRAYLHHLSRSGELAYYRLASIHNLWVMNTLSTQLRELVTAHAA